MGPLGGPFTIIFGNQLAGQRVLPLVATVGVAGPTATVAALAEGAGRSEVQELTLGGEITAGTFRIIYNGSLVTGDIPWSSTPSLLAQNIQLALNGVFGAGNTLVQSLSSTVYRIAFIGNLANANLQQLTTDCDGHYQQLTLGGAAGTITLSYDGVSAATLTAPYATLTANAIAANLNGIPALNGNITVSGPNGGPFNIVFKGALAAKPAATLVATVGFGSAAAVSTTRLLGTLPSVTPNTVVEGTGNEVQVLSVAGVVGSFRLSYNAVNAVAPINAPYTALLAATVQNSLNSIPFLAGNVTVIGGAGGPFTIVFRNALAGQNVLQIVATAQPGTTTTVGTLADGAGRNEVQQLNFANTTGGSFRLVYGSNLTTGVISWPLAVPFVPAQLVTNIQTALDGIFGAGNTLVQSVSNTQYLITYRGSLGSANLLQLTALSSLTPVGASVVPTTVVEGSGNEVQSLTLGGGPGTVLLSYNGVNATAAINAPFTLVKAADLLANLNTIPALNGNVTVLGADGGPFTIVFRNGLTGTNVALLVATATPSTAASVTTVADGVPICTSYASFGTSLNLAFTANRPRPPTPDRKGTVSRSRSPRTRGRAIRPCPSSIPSSR